MFITFLNGLALAGLLFSLAVGFSLIFGLMRIVNLAHGALFLIGSYVTYGLTSSQLENGTVGRFLLAVVAATALTALLGTLLMRLIEPLLGRGFFDQALLTLGIALLVAFTLQETFGKYTNTIYPPAAWSGSVSLPGGSYPVYNLGLIVVGLCIAVGTYVVIERTKLGALVRSTVSDRGMVRAMGINARRITYVTFAAGAALAGFAGAISFPFFATAPGVDNQVLLQALAVVVIGGLGSIRGAAVGALLVGEVQSVGTLLGPVVSPYLLFGLMLVVLAVRPRGIFGVPVSEMRTEPTSKARLNLPWSGGHGRAGGAALVAVAVALLLFPFIGSTFALLRASEIISFGLLAVSLDLLVGLGGMGSLGHAAFYGVGAYLSVKLGAELTDKALPLLLFAGLGAAAAAAATGWIAVRSRAVYFVMITLAIGQLFEEVAANGGGLTGATNGLVGTPIDVPDLGLLDGLPPVVVSYWYVVVIAAVLFLAVWRISVSPFGRALRGLRDNEDRMAALGYPVMRYRYGAFVLAAGIAGMAGSLAVVQFPFASPELLGFNTMTYLLIAVVIGGAGSVWGGFLGAAVVVYVNSVLANQLQGYSQLLLGLTFVALVYVLPGGCASLADRLRRRGPSPSAPARPRVEVPA
ncbi:ABC transporter permease [Pseudonocardia acaciae]|uniref:ABC transporter permease n=1 Tax=Pseudonocardia acaciae TaxID=551276 RepID=UPI000490506C|nr:ABC transporter permease [Pseudonocardia acaciae]